MMLGLRQSRLRRALLLLIVGTGWLGLVGGSAGAKNVHLHEGSEEIPGSGFISYLNDIAVNNSSGPSAGNVYIVNTSVGFFSSTSAVIKLDANAAVISSFNGSGTPAGPFAGDARVAIDSSSGPYSGSIYVTTAQAVNRFDEAGQYLCQITGSGTPSASECNGPAGSQTPTGKISPNAIEVDSAGTLYVADRQAQVIHKFTPDGAYIGQIESPHIKVPIDIAVDSTGALYVVNAAFGTSGSEVFRLTGSGELGSALDAEAPAFVAVDPASDEVFIAETGFETQLRRYDSTGQRIPAQFGRGEKLAFPAVAVGEATGRIYATHSTRLAPPASQVEIYSRGYVVPTAQVLGVQDVGEESASIVGAVDPDGGGDITQCRAELVAAEDYDPAAENPYAAGPGPVPCEQALPYEGQTGVSMEFSGLSPSTTYHFRLVAANANGVDSPSEDRTFATKGPPTVGEHSAAGIGRYSASLRAMVNPGGSHTAFRFEYVDATSFAGDGGFSSDAVRSTELSEIGTGIEVLSVSNGIAGLEIDTKYHYRVVAASGSGTAVGPGTHTFTTLPVARIEDQWAYGRLRSATVEAKINPLGLHTQCHVQYVAEERFEETGFSGADVAPCKAGVGDGTTEQVGRARLVGLSSGTDYRFRFIANNESGVQVGPDEAFATFGIEEFTVEAIDENGDPYTQAGGHPFETITRYSFTHNVVPSQDGTAGSLTAMVKELLIEQPVGRVGSTTAVPRCKAYQVEENRCSGDSQVGVVTVEVFDDGKSTRRIETREVYAIVPPKGVSGRNATRGPSSVTDSRIRTGDDYGITSGSFNISEESRIVSAEARYWGVPADSRHDGKRRCFGGSQGCSVEEVEPLALLRNPTSCTGPLQWTIRASSWSWPDDFAAASTETPGMTGCEQIEFDPEIEWRPTTRVADSPSGLRSVIHVPQDDDPYEPDVGDLKTGVTRSAKGLILNPAAANGLRGCSPAQFDIDGADPARCPDAAKVGTVEINTPMFDHPLPGAIFLATPQDNPFDSMFAIYLAIHDAETGVVVKLAGEVRPSAQDGQVTATFEDNPQLPIEDFKLTFFGGPRAVLRTPITCGTYRTDSTLTPWSAPHSGPPATASDSFEIDAMPHGGPCVAREADAPNRPSFEAGTVDPQAGSYTPFVVNVHRQDGTQQIADLKVIPPPGLLGRMAGITYCGDAEIAAAERNTGKAELASPSCPVSSRVGGVDVSIGSGPLPYHVEGTAYMADPYRGAPVSLVVVVPAVAGPFDLGTVVVRSALAVDLKGGQIDVRSDPVPTIVEGVALNVRSIAVRVDRPQFVVNPTSCRPMSVNGTVTSLPGQVVPVGSHFQAQGCRRLPFRPRLKLRLLGRTKRGAHPRVRAVLNMPRRGANIKRVAVRLPASQFFDGRQMRGICTEVEFEASSCPADSVYGYARAWTPLLDRPLRGPVYIRSYEEGLPGLVADLGGQFQVALEGRVTAPGGKIRANITGLPDAPVTKVMLTMKGGKYGLLQNSIDVCKHRQRAQVEFEAHNGKVSKLRPPMRGECAKRRD